MKKISIILSLLLLLCSCSTTSEIDDINDNYRTMYEIFVGSFSDSNDDGYGDLKGIINRFDYLNDGDVNDDDSLGIQGIWLSPIFKSNSYHKYDVIDYYTIDEDFGTMDDLKALIELAHSRNVIVILDLVINHTSNKNEWFTKFYKAHQEKDYDNYYYDFYSYCDKDNIPTNRTFNAIYQTNDYYECNFSTDMPELNFDNENVRQEVLNIAKYYLELGVDGFRFDAAKYIYYGDNQKSIDFWNWYIDELKNIKEDIYTVGEVWSSDSETISYIEALNCFNFTTSNVEGVIATAVKEGNVNNFTNYIVNYINRIKEKNTDAMPIFFLANHDMDRSAGYLNTTTKYAYMAANLYLLTPGSCFIYYGEEIGMKGSRGSSNTDANRRLAMLWGDDDSVKDPTGATFSLSKQINGTVKEQLNNKDSLYNYYRKVIQLRNKYPEIARGSYSAYKGSTNDAGGFIIEYNQEVTGLFHNTSSANTLTLDLTSYQFKEVVDYIGQGKATLKDGILTIDSQTTVILK